MEANGGAGGAEGAHGRESSSHAAAARLHASLQLASVYVHPTECAVAAGMQTSVPGRQRRRGPGTLTWCASLLPVLDWLTNIATGS